MVAQDINLPNERRWSEVLNFAQQDSNYYLEQSQSKKLKIMIKYIKLVIIALGFSACNNDDDNNTQDPLSQLPPMTTTGENTIGCLVNGEPFIDSGLMNNFYQFVGGSSRLVINWEQGSSSNFKDGQISIRNIEIE
jgi:hypothetical protein